MHNVFTNLDQTLTCVGTCPISGKGWELVVEAEQYSKWQDGDLIQNAFPELSADDRELLITGITAEAWDETFSDEV
jgi:hypothetical protein